jgi:hypothetical protein
MHLVCPNFYLGQNPVGDLYLQLPHALCSDWLQWLMWRLSLSSHLRVGSLEPGCTGGLSDEDAVRLSENFNTSI